MTKRKRQIPIAPPAAVMAISGALARFFRLEAAAGLLLMATAALAFIVSNSPLDNWYARLLDMPGQVRIGPLNIAKPLLLWINDFWMAIFFFLVGLEIKREVLEGSLSTRQSLTLPCVAALGGMIVPACIFAALNWQDPVGIRGWAIPAATDIAFALGVLTLLGDRVPVALKVFLAAVAIVDDLGAIIIIAIFYTADLNSVSLALACLGGAALIALNRSGSTSIPAYVFVGMFVWVCVLKSGVHATLAGVITALAIPMRGATPDAPSPARKLEHDLHPLVAYVILPMFAFANAGVSVADVEWKSLAHPVTMGIAFGLLFGKVIGVFSSTWLAVKLGWAKLPEGVDWRALFGVALLCGIGFTMSLFIGTLAWEDDAERFAVAVRLGVLGGSIVSALLGYACLRAVLPPRNR